MVKIAKTRKLQPRVALIVKPVTTHLDRLEALLIEMRHEQDVTLKRLLKLERAVDVVSALVTGRAKRVR